MATNITPRWEWRTFGQEFLQAEEVIKQWPLGNIKNSDELYVLSTVKNTNVKIRHGIIEVKILQAKNEQAVEQWCPAAKEGLPISANALMRLCKYMGTTPARLKRAHYTCKQFLMEVVEPNPLLKIVHVKKTRHIYVINQCIVEVADVVFAGMPLKTICIEHSQPEQVLRTAKELGLERRRNVSYIKALKRFVEVLESQDYIAAGVNR